MKRQVKIFIEASGGKAAYSGKDKTMYIFDLDRNGASIEQAVLDYFGYGLEFRLSSSFKTQGFNGIA